MQRDIQNGVLKHSIPWGMHKMLGIDNSTVGLKVMFHNSVTALYLSLNYGISFLVLNPWSLKLNVLYKLTGWGTLHTIKLGRHRSLVILSLWSWSISSPNLNMYPKVHFCLFCVTIFYWLRIYVSHVACHKLCFLMLIIRTLVFLSLYR